MGLPDLAAHAMPRAHPTQSTPTRSAPNQPASAAPMSTNTIHTMVSIFILDLRSYGCAMDWVTCTSAPCGCGGYFATLCLRSACTILIIFAKLTQSSRPERPSRLSCDIGIKFAYGERSGNFAPAQIIRPTEISDTIIVCGYGWPLIAERASAAYRVYPNRQFQPTVRPGHRPAC